jgi:hypothetical protein
MSKAPAATGEVLSSAANAVRQRAVEQAKVIKVGFMDCFELFPEDLFHVADFPLHFTGDLFCGTTVSQIWVSDGFTRFLFDFAHSFFGRAFNLIFCT